MKARLLMMLVLVSLHYSPLAAGNPKLLFNDSTLHAVRNVYNNPSIAFPFDRLKKSILDNGTLTSVPDTAGGSAVYDVAKANLAELLAFRYCVEANADTNLGDRAYYWLATKYIADNYVYQADNWSEWIDNGLALSQYCIAFDLLLGAGYFDPLRHPDDPHDQPYWNGLKQATAQRLHDKAAAIYNRVKNLRTVGDAASALIVGNQTILNEARFHAQIGNHRIIVASSLGVAAYLLADFGFKNDADLWLTFAKKDVEHFLLNRQHYPPLGTTAVTVLSQNVGGAFPEGIEYLNYSGRGFIPFMIASRVNGGENYFQDVQFKKIMDWCYDLQLPDGSAPQINSTGYGAYPINSLAGTVIPGGANYLGQLQRYYDRTTGAVDMPAEAFALLDSTAGPGRVSFAPITSDSTRGELIMRNDPVTPTRYVLVTAKNGPARFASELHGYADAGSFLFQADGKTLVLHPGYAGYADSKELARAKAHNTICPVVADSVSDDAPSRDVVLPPAADAWLTGSTYSGNFSYGALTMELYGSRPVNASDEAVNLFFSTGSFPYEYGTSLHVTWKSNGRYFGSCDRKFLLVNNSYLVVRDKITRTDSAMQYAVSYIHGNNGNNPAAAALSRGMTTGARGEVSWSTDGTSPVLRVNTAALGGKIARYSILEAAPHQAMDPVLALHAPRTTFFHAALRTACGFTNNYGQMLSILEADPDIASKSAVTTQWNADAAPYIVYTVDGRNRTYGRYDVLFSQKYRERISFTNSGLGLPIETDATFFVVSYGGAVGDTNHIHIFSNGASYLRCGAYTFLPRDSGDAQTAFTIAHAPTAVVRDARLPAQYELEQNFPNPFNPSTTIRYALPVESRVRLQVMNVLGQNVAVLVDDVELAGWKSAVWTPRVSSGVYFCRLEAVSVSDPARRSVQIRTMTVMK